MQEAEAQPFTGNSAWYESALAILAITTAFLTALRAE